MPPKYPIPTSSLLLAPYIIYETVRANYAYYAFHTFHQISASIVALLSEMFKLSIAAFFLLKSSDNNFSISALPNHLESAQNGEINFRKALKYALPASLYLINNLIYYIVLPLTTPKVFFKSAF